MNRFFATPDSSALLFQRIVLGLVMYFLVLSGFDSM